MKSLISLFDESGNMVRPWAEDGWRCYCIDILNEPHVEKVGKGEIHYLNVDLNNYADFAALSRLNPRIIFSFPPCTDLAVSGAAHFKAKRQRDPAFQRNAAALARRAEELSALCGGVPWMAENPVSVLSTLWRKPDHSFHPYEYGGYLPENDVHPRWPDYIAPRDRYRKKTCIWSGGGFIMPIKRSVGDPGGDSTQHLKLGGKSAKTKQIRSETPRGFAIAVKVANS